MSLFIKVFVFFIIFLSGLELGLLPARLTRPQTVTKTVVVTPTPSLDLDAYKIYNLVNDYRASKGLNKLVFDPSMCRFTKTRLSQVHTDWSHNGFYPQVLSYFSYTDAGENLIKGFFPEDAVLQTWIKSPEHLENIIKPAYTRTCIETDVFEHNPYAVQEFASY